MKKRVTVYDIAAELKISPSTVSRVLNNSSLISDKRSSQILKTAEQLGYQKRSIKKHVSRAILNIHIFLPQTDSVMIHFFYNISELIESIQKGFGDVRLNFITRVNDGNLDFLERKKTGQIDGCIFAFTRPSALLNRELSSRSIPSLLLNRRARSGNFICYDVSEGLGILASLLVKEYGGELNPCFLGYSGLPDVSQARYAAVESAFGKNSVPFGPENRMDIRTFDEIPTIGLDWIRKCRFNAVIAFNDLVALSVLHAAQARGISVPAQLALTGIDNSPLQMLLDRRIDTVSLSITDLGIRAGIWLKEYIIDRRDTPIREIITGTYIPGGTIRRNL